MRIAELSRQSGIPVPTIKYYLREGLLPPGELSSPNQARYDERHLRRLQLVRTLLEIGRLPIAAIKEIMTELDRPSPNIHGTLGRALQSAAAECAAEVTDPEVDELVARHGWQVDPAATARQTVADVLAALRRLGAEEILTRLDDYAAAADRIAQIDLELVGRRETPEDIVYHAVVGTILGDVLIAALRRLAQESRSSQVYQPRFTCGEGR